VGIAVCGGDKRQEEGAALDLLTFMCRSLIPTGAILTSHSLASVEECRRASHHTCPQRREFCVLLFGAL
jgi:hypothetical protein